MLRDDADWLREFDLRTEATDFCTSSALPASPAAGCVLARACVQAHGSAGQACSRRDLGVPTLCNAGGGEGASRPPMDELLPAVAREVLECLESLQATRAEAGRVWRQHGIAG